MCTEPVNLRLGFERLEAFVEECGKQLDSGDVYMFLNSKRDRCKFVWHDGCSYNMFDHRLNHGVFVNNPDAFTIARDTLSSLLEGNLLAPFQLMQELKVAVRTGNVIPIKAARGPRP
jgi:hypothetical protein